MIAVQGDFKNLFLIKDKQIKVKGGINHFGITVKRKGDKIPWELRKNFENVTVYIKCTGKDRLVKMSRAGIIRHFTIANDDNKRGSLFCISELGARAIKRCLDMEFLSYDT